MLKWFQFSDDMDQNKWWASSCFKLVLLWFINEITSIKIRNGHSHTAETMIKKHHLISKTSWSQFIFVDIHSRISFASQFKKNYIFQSYSSFDGSCLKITLKKCTWKSKKRFDLIKKFLDEYFFHTSKNKLWIFFSIVTSKNYGKRFRLKL